MATAQETTFLKVSLLQGNLEVFAALVALELWTVLFVFASVWPLAHSRMKKAR